MATVPHYSEEYALAGVNFPYSEEYALAALNFSNAAYCFDSSPNNSTDWSCLSCMKACDNCTVNYFVNKTVQAAGYVAGNEDRITVSFRGSEYIQNWIQDAQYFQTPHYCDECTVHKGFFQSWDAIKEQVLEAIHQQHVRHPQARLYVTGHSLGAAIGVNAAVTIVQELGLEVTSMYTFGLPRVGNDKFRTYFNSIVKKHFRITHWRDPVPHLPPKVFGYWHVGTEVFYDEESTNFTVCDGSGEDPLCSNQFYMSFYINDHRVYIRTPMGCE